ncbi:MAG: exo-alpha-sialidase [Proteobacteria bacterium]|nr:exo-alpha-sialidase [Pseudomonadota bacterium]
MFRVVPLVVATLLVCGCKNGDPGILASSDVRIDMAPSNNDPDSVGPVMCVNSVGQVFVVWTDDRDGKSDVWINKSTDAGRSWMPAAVRVNQGLGNVSLPHIACTNDSVYVVWEDDRDGELENHNIYLNRSTGDPAQLAEDWEDVDTLLETDDDGVSMSLGPQVAAVGTDVYVAWFDDLNGSFDIFVAASEDGGEDFAVPIRADSDAAGAAYSAWPLIHATTDGDVYVVWEESRDGAQDIYFARSKNKAQSFKPDMRIDKGDASGQNDSFEPQFDADNGVIYVVWHDTRNGDGRDIMMNYSTNNGETWLGAAERVDTDNVGIFDSLYPDVVVNGETAHICWSDTSTAAGGYDIYYRRAVEGDLKGDEMLRLNTDPQGYFNHTNCEIELNAEAGLVVAWQDARDDLENKGHNDLYYNYSTDDGASWNGTDLRIDSMDVGATFKIDLDIALHKKELLSVWTDGRTGTADIYFHHLQVGEESGYVEEVPTE